MSRKISEEDIKQLIQRYLKEIKEYSELVLVLATLKKTFHDISMNKRISAGVYIEDTINYLNKPRPKTPDLIILEHYEKIGAALDHKYTKTRSKEHLRRVIEDITKYRGTALIDGVQYKILDCFMIIPESYFKIIKDILLDLIRKEKHELALISYLPNYEELELTLMLHNPLNLVFNSKIIRSFFTKYTRKVKIPSAAHYQYKFIKQKPPISYLLVEVYHTILEGGVGPYSRTVIVQFDAILNRIKTYYPRWITHSSEYEQIPRNRLLLAIQKLREIGIIEIQGNKIKAKRPKKSVIEYVLEKLAKWEIKHGKPLQRKLDEFF